MTIKCALQSCRGPDVRVPLTTQRRGRGDRSESRVPVLLSTTFRSHRRHLILRLQMGSSKRSHKDRSRGKRSRSRSGSRERSGHDRKARRNSEAEKRESVDDEPEEGEITPEHDARGEEVSLSIAETNKLRAKLGLKPLEDGSEKAADGDDSYDKRPEVFVKTDNISDKIEAEKVKERVSVVREKRKYAEKLRSTKTLADSDSEEDVVSWVEKQRELEKRKAEQKIKELDELDQELERVHEQESRQQRAYRAEHLKGLTVAHSVDAVKEGSQVVLTLRDKDVLEEENEDVLENVNIVDNEKAAENVINRKKGLNDYNPYDLGDDGQDKSMLSKYDETIGGKVQQKFTIGTSAMDDVQQKIKAMREAATKGKVLISLEDTGVRGFASEFYTEEEMLKFKKPKKVRKRQTLRKRNTADEIVSQPSATSASADSGSRVKSDVQSQDEGAKPQVAECSTMRKVDTSQILHDVVKMETDETEEDLSNVIVDDEAEKELQEALERARKLKEKTKSAEAKQEEFARKILVKQEDEDMGPSRPSAVVFNATSEFCRNLGDVSSYTAGPSSARDFDDEEEIVRKREEKKDVRVVTTKKPKEDEQRKGDWRQVDLDAEEEDAYQTKSSSSGSSSQKSRRKVLKSVPILEEEPDASQGVAAALRLAMNKGYLDKEVTKSAPQKKAIEAASYTIEEKFYDEEKGRGRDRYAGPLSEFKDKSGYKPDVKLEYVDDHGRVMSQKEAFRVLSHKFHGKGPGKNKIDKRQQKLMQESKLRQMSSIDTPLNTVQKLQEKQKELSLPYVVLSGAGYVDWPFLKIHV